MWKVVCGRWIVVGGMMVCDAGLAIGGMWMVENDGRREMVVTARWCLVDGGGRWNVVGGMC